MISVKNKQNDDTSTSASISTSPSMVEAPAFTEPEITPALKNRINYESYAEGWFSVEIPEDWSVQTGDWDGSASAFVVRIYDAAVPDRQVFTAVSTLWFKSEGAYNGFTDSYEGLKYAPITEDMYTCPIAGYIE